MCKHCAADMVDEIRDYHLRDGLKVDEKKDDLLECTNLMEFMAITNEMDDDANDVDFGQHCTTLDDLGIYLEARGFNCTHTD